MKFCNIANHKLLMKLKFKRQVKMSDKTQANRQTGKEGGRRTIQVEDLGKVLPLKPSPELWPNKVELMKMICENKIRLGFSLV